MGLTKKYRVLIKYVTSDKTGKRFKQDETFTSADFDTAVIEQWLELDIVEEVVSDGGNTKR